MALVRRSVALALAAALLAAPAAAQTVDTQSGDDQESNDAARDAIVALQAEVLVLVELGAFDAVPPILQAVHREWVEYTDGFTRDGLLQWLYDTDADGVAALERLVASGARPSPAMMVALGSIGSDDRLALEGGGRIAIAPGEYAAALGNLESNFNGVDEVIDGVSPLTRTPAATPASVDRSAAREQGGAQSPPAAETGAYPWFAVSLAISGVLLVGLFMVLIGRRRAASPGGSGVFDRLLDAGRRMTSALDRTEIATIAVNEATMLAQARIGAFIDVKDGGLALAHQNGDLVDDRRLGDGVLSRVADTGRAVRVVSNDEPAITALPAALLAVPVIGEGSVSGIVLLVRPDESPFSDWEEDVVGRLAPMVGSALAAADAHGDIAELTRTDALTGLGNRRSLDADLAAALVDLNNGSSLGVVMVDVDHFKHFNDTNGHAAGDQALRAVAAALRDSVRAGDVAYRYGGEEFSLLLRDVTLDQVLELAERVRRTVESIAVVGADLQPDGRLTISLGVALVSGGGVDAAIAAADAALYEAKQSGRNRIAVAGQQVPIA